MVLLVVINVVVLLCVFSMILLLFELDELVDDVLDVELVELLVKLDVSVDSGRVRMVRSRIGCIIRVLFG